MQTTLTHEESSDASDRCSNDVDPMDAAIDDALDLVEAALLEMSTFNFGDRELPSPSPVLINEVVGFFLLLALLLVKHGCRRTTMSSQNLRLTLLPRM